MRPLGLKVGDLDLGRSSVKLGVMGSIRRTVNVMIALALAALVSAGVEGLSQAQIHPTNSPEVKAAEFQGHIRPLLQEFCFDCHGDGANKGGVTFDQFKSPTEMLDNRPSLKRLSPPPCVPIHSVPDSSS